ncbi:MAG: low temperature requirement protein A [Acidimicrobiales bacterium]
MKGLVVPSPTEDFTADPVELFFDLAFVFAFSQLVWHLVHFPTWSGAAEAGLLFLILWFVWSTFTWAANAVQGNAREVRAIFLVATAASVPMGASITAAFTSGGGTFAIGASIIVLMGLGLQAWGLSGEDDTASEFQSVLRYGTPNLLAMALLIIGGFLDEGPRKVLWVLFVLLLLSGMGIARFGDWLVRPGHFAERHGLIVIIALGEVVVAIGIAVVSSFEDAAGLPNDTLIALGAAGAMAGLLWWSYFDRVLPALEHRANELTGRPRAHFIADVYTGFHIFIVAGIIALAAAAEEILLHPRDAVHTEFLVMFVGGLALYFGGIAVAAYRAYRAIAKERILAMTTIALVAILGSSMDGVVLLIIVDVILLVTLLAEHRRIEAPNEETTEAAVAN